MPIRYFWVILLLLNLCFSFETKAGDKIGTYDMVASDTMKYGYANDFCYDFLLNLREFEDEPYMMEELYLSPKYPQFRAIQWEDMDIQKNMALLDRLFDLFTDVWIDREKKALKDGTYVAKRTFIKDLFPDHGSVLIAVGPKDGVFSQLGTIFVLDETGKEVEKNAFYFAMSKRGELGFHNGGHIFYYNDELLYVQREYSPRSIQDLPSPDGVLTLSVFARKGVHLKFDLNGKPYIGGLGAMGTCLYTWRKNKETTGLK